MPGQQSNLNDDYFRSIEESHSVGEVGPHAQVAPVELRALERVHGGGGGLGVAVLDDGRARGPLGPAAREELDGGDLRAGVVFLHVHKNSLATRQEARREDFLVVHCRHCRVATVLYRLFV